MQLTAPMRATTPDSIKYPSAIGLPIFVLLLRYPATLTCYLTAKRIVQTPDCATGR
ncbi:MAG: hypothetical protein IPM47_06035 [Sphingobacteriales bacterium]|nr:MAG: hypothetical protein IPM47_06035 [Sphingobacteriales bacterium]